MRLDPRHPETEALWRAVTGAGVRSIAVVAARPGEGCSSVAEALWRRAACAGRSALLVDLNTEHPGLGARLGRPRGGERQLVTDQGVVTLERRRDPGGLRLVAGRRGTEIGERRAAMGEAQRLGHGGLGLLAEPGAAAIEAWRDPARLREAVAGWLRDWDTVVIDTAPLVAGTAQGVPGLAAAAAAEASLLVILAGRTPTSAVREASQALRKAGARLLGTVMNDRDNPSLRAELERQALRLARLAPAMAAGLARRIRGSALLGMRI
ncbi:MAG: hypothetical protein EON47_10045 [Acetobacteraceae bacterium]|nr:MAG: hypothetical protein EON47_10045 [Acetobacteraceae bacterium]